MVGTVMTATEPIVAICRPACGRPLRAIPDVPINFLVLNCEADASGKPLVVYLAEAAMGALNWEPQSTCETRHHGAIADLVVNVR